jgi:uncharacterized protein (DUF1015 family)
MAILKPFAALRPKTELAEKICELPYDVMSSDEAREVAAIFRNSFPKARFNRTTNQIFICIGKSWASIRRSV